ncbi:hypothetical protein BV898_14005 [Hypsibius exemplaris]|uniref:Uncharacterized protein n=1 Tax=Hypsibius exemplaris TaxID=2072580 RepID=A0A1W0W8X4_HYPEX|nr:hypothetical protein BV898_14005 [Hypsibius exemplaris]
MKILVLFALVCLVASQRGDSKIQAKFVRDLLKPALSAEEIQTLVTSREATFPMLHGIPQTNFCCASKAQPGFYADEEAKCQHNHQITLVCDSWFNVDCERSANLENFVNSRFYTGLPLFDSPPADYISPSQLVLIQNQGLAAQVVRPSAPASIKGGKKHPNKPVSVSGFAEASSD